MPWFLSQFMGRQIKQTIIVRQKKKILENRKWQRKYKW